MNELRELVIALATMSESSLREARSKVNNMGGSSRAKELVLHLIELNLSVGSDTDERAKAAAACLIAIDTLEKQRNGGSSSSSGGCLSVILVAITLVASALWLC